MGRTLLLPLTFLLGACMPALYNQPVRFGAAVPAGDPVGSVAQAMAAAGATPVTVDSRFGLIQTRWQDTGFGFGFVQRQRATIVLRYVASVQPGPQGMTVTLRGEAQKCAEGGFTVGDTDVRGPCETLEGLIEQHQQELEALGQRVMSSMAGANVTVSAATY